MTELKVDNSPLQKVFFNGRLAEEKSRPAFGRLDKKKVILISFLVCLRVRYQVYSCGSWDIKIVSFCKFHELHVLSWLLRRIRSSISQSILHVSPIHVVLFHNRY